MSLDFIGYLVSIECSPNRFIEGRISSLDTTNNTITIMDPIMDGKKSDKQKLLIHNSSIINLRIIDKPTIDDVVSILDIDPKVVLDEEDEPIIDVKNVRKLPKNDISPNNLKKSESIKFLTENDILNQYVTKIKNEKNDFDLNSVKYLNENEMLKIDSTKQLSSKIKKPAVIPVYEDHEYSDDDVRTKPVKKKGVVKDTPTVSTTNILEPTSTNTDTLPIVAKKFGGVRMIPTSCIKSMNRKGKISVLADAMKQEICTKNSLKDHFIENISPKNTLLSSNDTNLGDITTEHRDFGQFKYFFHPQVPDPNAIEALKQKKKDKKNGESENKKSTQKLKNSKSNKYGNDFDVTLDYDLINTDFDFDLNLSKFNEDMKDLEISCSPKKNSKNYGHDENVLNDPTRIKSWTMKTRKTVPSFKSLFIQPVTSGFDLPFFSLADKKAYIKEGIKYLGKDIVYSTLADRLFSFVIESSCRCEFTLQNTVVIGDSNSDPTLIKRLSIHLCNRGIYQNDSKSLITFVGVPEDPDFPDIKYVKSAKQLSLNTRCIILLSDDMNSLPKDLSLWLTRMGNGPNAAHVFAIDFEPLGLSQVHVLFTCFGHDSSAKIIGHGKHFNTRISPCSSPTLHSETSTSNSQHNSRNVTNIMFDSDAAICDLGIPLSWIDAESRQALSQIFATQFLFRL
uniref:LSM14 domain-containing protein n=1 Tax=Strongyloides venezuelensis TaxID=75913 RepID=A0A0K0FHC0_STRVS